MLCLHIQHMRFRIHHVVRLLLARLAWRLAAITLHRSMFVDGRLRLGREYWTDTAHPGVSRTARLIRG